MGMDAGELSLCDQGVYLTSREPAPSSCWTAVQIEPNSGVDGILPVAAADYYRTLTGNFKKETEE